MKSNDMILSIIKTLQNKHKNLQFSSGNCGTFAVALSIILHDFFNINVNIGIIYKHIDEYDPDIDDIINAQTEIYHLYLQYNNILYDGTGIILKRDLKQFAKRQYDDSNPCFSQYYNLNQINKIASLVRTQTNWNISYNVFYNKFKKTLNV